MSETEIVYVEDLEDGRKQLRLDHPIASAAGDMLHALVLRDPTAADLRMIDRERGEVGKAIVLLARVADQPVKVIEQLRSADFARAQEVVTGFMGKSLPTGPTS